MHGLIHVVFKQFTVDTYGDRTWGAVLDKLGLDSDAPILHMVQYEDETTLSAVCALVEELGVTLDELLEPFGGYFVRCCSRQGWASMLKSMGRDLKEFLQNVNGLHHFLERDFRGASFPCFTVEDDPAGLKLTYTSSRFLPALALGILRELALALFGRRVEAAEVCKSKKSVTWLVVDVGPVKPEQEVPMEAAPPGVCFSFHTFHEAMASISKCLPSLPIVPLCQPAAAPPQSDVVLVPPEAVLSEKDTEEDPHSGRRHRLFAESPYHELAPSPARAVAMGMDCDSADSIVASVRAEHGIPPDLGLVEAITQMSADDRLAVARKLVRSVSAELVATTWTAMDSFDCLSKGFWNPDNRLAEYFMWSSPVFLHEEQIMTDAPFRFLSHAWNEPKDWGDLMPGCPYRELKAAELCLVAKDIASQDLEDPALWTEVRLWIDKCCICQESSDLLGASIHLIEEFLELCEGLVVLFTWSYLSRLWCVYEWACFLVFHDPEDLFICADTWCRDWTQERFLRAVRDFKVDACECSDPSDRVILSKKIKEYYSSEEGFERFLKFTAIALLARSLATRGGRFRESLACWAELAEQCGFDDLAEALRVADPVTWRAKALNGRTDCLTYDLQDRIKEQCDIWFSGYVVPLISKEREKAVSEAVRGSMAMRKDSIRSTYSQKTPTVSVRHCPSRRSRRSSSMTATDSMVSRNSSAPSLPGQSTDRFCLAPQLG